MTATSNHARLYPDRPNGRKPSGGGEAPRVPVPKRITAASADRRRCRSRVQTVPAAARVAIGCSLACPAPASRRAHLRTPASGMVSTHDEETAVRRRIASTRRRRCRSAAAAGERQRTQREHRANSGFRRHLRLPQLAAGASS